MSKETLSCWPERYKSLAFWWSVGFGAGLLRPAPGTWGSLLGLITGYGVLQTGWPVWGLLAGAFAVTMISVWSIGRIEAACGVHDAPEIVVDEIAGQWITMVPLALLPFSWPAFFAAFALFRLFDIVKPWPIGVLDRNVSGGFGVMVDDIVAGIFSATCLYLLMFYVA